MDALIEKEKALVRQLLSLDMDTAIMYIDSGWTSRVYLVDKGKFVVKFPRKEEVKNEYRREVTIFKLLPTIKSQVIVPSLHSYKDNYDYLIYEGIIGTALDTLPNKLNEQIQKKIGAELGEFLKQMHRMALSGARVMTIADEIRQFQRKYESVKSRLGEYLNNEEQQLTDNLIYQKMPEDMENLGYEKALCHGDLGYWNLILTDQNQLGIIDFGDIGYWDKSKDFAGLQDITMLNAALAVYGDNENLRKKITLRKKIVAFLDLPYYSEQNDKENVIKTIQIIKQSVEA